MNDHPLVAVVAPMGYGKSTAARDLAHKTKRLSYVVTFPPGPHDPRYLWNYVFQQLKNQGLDAAADLQRLGFPETPPKRRRALRFMRRIRRPSLLILDDYHHVDIPTIDGILAALARADLPYCRVALFSRVRPDMPLEDLCLKNRAAVFGQEALAFSDEEAKAFFRLHGIADPSVAEAAHRYSEGWPAALWLCLQSWRRTGCPQPSGDVEALLAANVFAGHDREGQLFLLRLSALENFTPAEAEAITGRADARRRLKTLRDRNAFLNYSESGGRYQLHGLFRDFLRREAAAAPEIDQAAWMRRAGDCLAARGDAIGALRLFVRAGRDGDLLRLLDLFEWPACQPLFFYFLEETRVAVTSIPWRLRLKRPFAYLRFVYFLLVDGADLRAADLLDEAAARFRRTRSFDAALRRRLAGEVMLVRGLLAFNDSRIIVRYFLEARKLLAGHSELLTRNLYWNFACPHTASLLVREPGDYEDIVALIERFWPVLSSIGDGCGMGCDPLLRGELHLERGEFDSVRPCLDDAVRRGTSRDQVATLLSTDFTRARLLLAEGESEAALARLEAWRPSAEQSDTHDHGFCLDLALGYLAARMGRPGAIPPWLNDLDSYEPLPATIQTSGMIYAIHGMALLAKGAYDRLAILAKGFDVYTSPYQNLFSRIHGKLLDAIATRQLRGDDAAMAPFKEALALSRPDGVVLTVAEYGGHIVPLAERFLRESESGDDAHVARILELARRQASHSDAPTAGGGEPLTRRETEMMRMVLKGETNARIGKRLHVAEITVKKTLSTAYAKLGARNRVDAARRFTDRHPEIPDPKTASKKRSVD